MIEAQAAIKPHPGPQTDALCCPVGDILYGGARGGGKGIWLALDWLRHADASGGRARGLLVRRFLTDLKDWIRETRPIYTKLGWEFKESEKEWRHPSGSVLSLGYLEREEDAQRYQGHNLSWVAVDEAGQFKTPAAIDLLQGTLRLPGVEHCLRLTANPGGPGHTWLRERYVLPASPCTPFNVAVTMPDGTVETFKRVYIPARLKDNPSANTTEYRVKLASSGPAWLVKAWLEGDWNVQPLGGLIDVDKVNFGTPPRLGMLVQGWDTAFSKKTTANESAGATIGRDEAGRVWCIDVRHGRWHPGEVAKEIVKMRNDHRAQEVCCEGGSAGLSVDHLVKDHMQREGAFFTWTLISHMQDKVAKNATLAGIINGGQFWVPEGAAWWPYSRDQLLTFSGEDGIPDDVVDGMGVATRRLDEVMLARPNAEPPKPPPDYERRDRDRRPARSGDGLTLFGGR